MTDTNAGTARIFRSDDGKSFTVAHQRATQPAPSFWSYPTLAEAQDAYPGAVLEGPGETAAPLEGPDRPGTLTGDHR
jgi:hypothetical protein